MQSFMKIIEIFLTNHCNLFVKRLRSFSKAFTILIFNVLRFLIGD